MITVLIRYVPAVVAVGQYFSRRLSFATGDVKFFLPPLQMQRVPSSSINWLFFSQVSVWQDLVSAPLCLLRLHLLLSSGRGGGAATGLVAIFTSILFFLFCFMHCIDKYDIYLHSSRKSSRFNVKVMAGICSLGLICGLALAPKAKKHTRFFKFSLKFESWKSCTKDKGTKRFLTFLKVEPLKVFIWRCF